MQRNAPVQDSYVKNNRFGFWGGRAVGTVWGVRGIRGFGFYHSLLYDKSQRLRFRQGTGEWWVRGVRGLGGLGGLDFSKLYALCGTHLNLLPGWSSCVCGCEADCLCWGGWLCVPGSLCLTVSDWLCLADFLALSGSHHFCQLSRPTLHLGLTLLATFHHFSPHPILIFHFVLVQNFA